MDQVREYTAHNRRGWDDISGARASGLPAAEFFRAGGVDLDQPDIDAMGPVAGARLLHLQCAHGSDTLSWANLGAHVTGVDISEVGIAAARAHAAEAGIAAEYLVADVFDLPADLGGFDIVYTGGGALCWLPDLDRWAAIVADCLRPGGVVHIAEHHPIWEVVEVTAAGTTVTRDYFSRGVPVAQAPSSKSAAGGAPAEPFVTFQWPIGDVVTALIRAGFRIESLAEHPLPAIYGAGSPAADWLPAIYIVRASLST